MRQSTSKVKTGQLWSKSKADLAKQLGELKTELGQLRTQKIAGGSASKLTKMCVLSALRATQQDLTIQELHDQQNTDN
jgi:ribosomal protein L29